MLRHRFVLRFVLICSTLGSRADAEPPVVTVTADDTVIRESCRIVIPKGTIIADANNDGVIKLDADGIVVEFDETARELMAVAQGTPWDRCAGIGVRIDGRKNVTLRRAHVHGYKVNVWATNADGLVLEDCDVAEGYAARLKSTPEREDGSDWLYPHHNDRREWATNHGAAICIERSVNVTVRGCFARRRQNGIVLDRVADSKLYDNDFSFLSGWGLAMWRSSGNLISRNAFDFCVRGHSEGVYNRGQDSAGILMFEQCDRNVVVENSVTHGGDGIFGFAGIEALNGEGAPPGYDHTRKGCNDNLFAGNDLSYAPAHGLEMTFSFGNRIVGNRFVENAICGVWGGYSQDTVIDGNRFEGNGGRAYGLERGGVNIEHGARNLIVRNTFVNNRCGVHLWWDPHGDFETKAWGRANYVGVRGNRIVGNEFVINADQPFGGATDKGRLVALHLRDVLPRVAPTEHAAPHVVDTTWSDNTFRIDPSIGVEKVIEGSIELEAQSVPPGVASTEYHAIGETRPVGARAALRGRASIIMGEWFPWDHRSPMVRARSSDGSVHQYEVFAGANAGGSWQARNLDTGETRPWAAAPSGERPLVLTVSGQGVTPYRWEISDGRGWSRVVSGVVIGAQWNARFFPWDDRSDPRTALDAWRAVGASDRAVEVALPELRGAYGMGGPRDQPWGKAIADRLPGPDHFGMIARATLKLPKGRWRFRTYSDDGVRVTVAGTPVIENWTWHAPTSDEGVFSQAADGDVEVVVEHFEIDGHSTLSLDISPG
ncbi:MAG: right-handed parallel beta-helix repeat-containing protein [Phycisphaerae bacterium]|nr:right-handed parallel beta-helix repeat-containing protein [Phycisphaerae bacterium]